MKITQPAPTSFSGYENRTGNVQGTGAYKIGQILDATVLSNSSHGQVSLRLGNANITASTNIPLHQHAHLTLKVIQLQPQLLLKLIPSAANNPLLEAMKNMLPKQTSLAPLLAEVVHKALAKENNSNQSQLRAAGNALITALPGRSDIKQVDGLKQAVMQSGIFLEAKLANPAMANSPGVSSDLKTLLLRYLAALSKTHREVSAPALPPMQPALTSLLSEIRPPLRGRLPIRLPWVTYKDLSSQGHEPDNESLLKKVKGALARLGLLQIATLENHHDGQTLWQLELPVRHGNAIETVSLTVEKEQEQSAEEEKASWAVNLSLDLPQLGALQSRISMDKLGLSTTFWSESEKTLSVIENRLSELRANFEKQGLETHKLSCREGQQAPASPTQPDSPLIDYQV